MFITNWTIFERKFNMTSAISALSAGLSLIDAINNSDKKDDKDKNKSLEDIFSQILDEIAENIEKQIEQDRKQSVNSTNSMNFGAPFGFKFENSNF